MVLESLFRAEQQTDLTLKIVFCLNGAFLLPGDDSHSALSCTDPSPLLTLTNDVGVKFVVKNAQQPDATRYDRTWTKTHCNATVEMPRSIVS